MQSDRLFLAFGNKSRVGKDTAVAHIKQLFESKYGGDCAVHIVRFADPLYNVHNVLIQEFGLPACKNPAILQYIGKMREIGLIPPDTFVNAADKKIQKIIRDNPTGPLCILVPDLRYSNENVMLRRWGFKCVQIVRENRPIDRDPTAKSECELDDPSNFDIVIVNDGSLSDFLKRVDDVVK